ncbi:MAG: hypothetical protein H7A24_15635 [Leptospiraceae bacterium]|nr:hypothetical protein [Leptospiraceae bacterium]MCP5513318.1 hypothetical protein [Leptospiraceae bacterium]
MVVISYFFIRHVWFHKRKIHHIAIIEKLEICTIEPDLLLPEINVYYKYYFGGGVYTGRGYLLLTDFLKGEYFLEFNQFHEPILTHNDKTFVSEEHIENYLLSIVDTLSINVDPIEPFHSEIIEIFSQSKSTQNRIQ